MTRFLFIATTVLFWSAITWLVLQGQLDEPAPALTQAAPEAAETIEASFSLDTLARHDHIDDCWMAIDGVVYDFTDYIARHPTAPEVMTIWCGRDASVGYHTKGIGQPHSRRADALLGRYRIGVLD